MDVVLFGELNSALLEYLTLFFHFALVADEVDLDVLGRMVLDLLEPFDEIRKRLVPSDIISEEHAVSAAIEYARHRSERLLTSL